MGRKVLISFLGTTPYFPVRYEWGDGSVSQRTPFVQEVIVSNLCKNWTEKDCIMVFRTKESNKANWIDKTDENGNVISRGLESTLRSLETKGKNGECKKLACLINPERNPETDGYMIATGLSEKELEEIFDKVFEKLNKDDEIYFDITHAFRTIPLFASVLFNYARFLKHTAIKGIYYGAFEKLTEKYGSVFNIRNLEPTAQNELVAPIVDLTNIVRLQEITSAAASFRDFGNMSSFSNLLHDADPKENDENISNIAYALDDLDFFMQTCQIDAIRSGEYIKDIKDSIENFCTSSTTNKAQKALLRNIYEKLDKAGFTPGKSYGNVIAAINWAMEFNMIQQALTMAQELIVTVAYDKLVESGLKESFVESIKSLSGKKKIKKFDIRKKLGDLLRANKYEAGDGYEFDRESEFNAIPAAIELIEEYPSLFVSLSESFKQLTPLRNILNHANTTNDELNSYTAYQEKFNACWHVCRNIIEKL